ncbi:MAG: hypothetical protein WC654_05320 [Patescibacteria group bacterium]
MVVVEKDSDEGFVVMDLHQYEILHDSGFESDLTSPPDRRTVVRAGNLQPPTPNIWDVMPDAKNQGETWDPDNLSEDEMVDLEKQYEQFAKRSVKEAIGEIQVQPMIEPEASEHPEPPVSKKDEDFGEEQFYLEPVE